ncbi:MAG TPA: STAS domain-containing protein [Micromonosporaceae bacterium]
MELSLRTRTVADRTVLEVGGEIDVYTAPRLKERLLELVADGTRQIVVDLEAVEFLDSTGLGVLVGGLRRIRAQGGHLMLVSGQERILKIFRITGLAGFFDIYPSVEAAIRPDSRDIGDGSTGAGASSAPVT